ncbi:HAMP domain-containing protein [bacterium]|nr:HAMP domain-containing protein [bacterium]
MRVKLFHKLFGAFFLTSIMIVGLMIFILRYYVSGSFSDYVNKTELDLQENIIDDLKSIYSKQNNWESLKSDRNLWREVTRKSVFSRHPHIMLPPPPPSELEKDLEDPETHRKEFDRRIRIGKLRSLSLFDSNQQPIAGSPGDTTLFTLKPILLNGETIGWLGLRKRRTLSHPLDISFLRQQTQVIYLVGGGILALALIISFLLSKHLLSPVIQLTHGTKSIAGRKFHTRIRINSRDELGELATDFNQMAATLEKFEEQRKQWITDITHELGTPISILRGEIEAMQDGIRKIDDERLASLHFEVLHLGKIVNDLKELSLVETGGFSFNKVPLNPIIVLRETLKIFESRFSERKIVMEQSQKTTESITIAADKDRLQQVFSNVLENALRYSDSPGSLKTCYEVNGSNLLISFEDSGPGVPEESLPYLFDRLYRVEKSRNRAKGGTGLGLAISKHIVEMAHNGTITASNVPGNGLRIEITLPIT